MTWSLYGKTFHSHLLLGTANYPSLEELKYSINNSQTEIVTVSLRRHMVKRAAEENKITSQQDSPERFWQTLQSLKVDILPNTAGCRSVKEAVTTAHMAREVFKTDWIKLEVIGDEYTLCPHPFLLLEAAKILITDGFKVFPYMTEDLILAESLLEAGCEVLMPWGSPIGSGQGLNNIYGLKILRHRYPHIPMIIDAGLGVPSHATKAMELGFNGVLLNTAVSQADQPSTMAKAFALAVEAGLAGFHAGAMSARDFAVPSTPTLGTPFWHN